VEEFQRTMEDYFLNDLGFFKPKFMWINGREGEDFTQERLDKTVANPQSCGLFKKIEVMVMTRRSSDYNPILISFNDTKKCTKGKRRMFRVESSWKFIPESKERVKQIWTVKQSGENTLSKIYENLQRC
jgi:hypothetical protein